MNDPTVDADGSSRRRGRNSIAGLPVKWFSVVGDIDGGRRRSPRTNKFNSQQHWLNRTPRVGSLGRRMGDKSQEATASAHLSYDRRSWLATLRLLDLRGVSQFVLLPWLFFSCLSITLAIVHHVEPEQITSLWSDVPTVAHLGLGSVMSLLLAFRLNASYTRCTPPRSNRQLVSRFSGSLQRPGSPSDTALVALLSQGPKRAPCGVRCSMARARSSLSSSPVPPRIRRGSGCQPRHAQSATYYTSRWVQCASPHSQCASPHCSHRLRP